MPRTHTQTHTDTRRSVWSAGQIYLWKGLTWLWTHQGFGVTEDVVLEELVQHVEEAVLHQRLDDQLVQVMLRRTNAHVRHAQRRRPGDAPQPYLHWDLELVEGADVLHQHGDGELVGRALRDRPTVRRHPSAALNVAGRFATFLSVNDDTTCVYMSDWSMTA